MAALGLGNAVERLIERCEAFEAAATAVEGAAQDVLLEAERVGESNEYPSMFIGAITENAFQFRSVGVDLGGSCSGASYAAVLARDLAELVERLTAAPEAVA